MGRKCCIKIKKCKKSCSSSSSSSCSSSSSSSSCSSSSSSSCCAPPCPNPYNATGSVTGTVTDSTFTAATITNMSNVTVNSVSTYVGPTNVAQRYGKKSKCCPVYLTVSGSVVNGTVQVVNASSPCYNAGVNYTNAVTVALNTTLSAITYTATLQPNQAIAFVPYTTTGASSMTYTYGVLSGNCC